MLGNALNPSQKTNLAPAKNIPTQKVEMSPRARHFWNLINRLLNEYFGVLTVAVVILVLFLSYHFLLWPKYQGILNKIKTTAFESKQLEPKYQDLANYKKLAEDYAKINKDDLAKYQGLVPKRYSKEDLFAETIFMLDKAGFVVDSLDVSNPGEETGATDPSGRSRGAAKVDAKGILPKNISKATVKLGVSKIDYNGLKKILSLVENNLRLSDIEKITFDPAQKIGVLEWSTYYFKN